MVPTALAKVAEVNLRHRHTFTPAKRAAASLGLMLDWQPTTNFSKRFAKLPGGQRQVLEMLRGTTDPTLQPLMALYESLVPKERKGCTLDMLIAAAKVEDPHAVWGAMAAELSRSESHTTSMMIALSGPDIVQAAIDSATNEESPRAHADRKMLLSALGTVPVPKSSVTNINARIDARQQHNTLNLQAPRLEDIVRTVADVAQVPPE